MAAVPQDPGTDPGLALPANEPQVLNNKEKVGLHTTSGTAIDIDADPKKLADNHPYENDAELALGGTPHPTSSHIESPEKQCLGSCVQWDPRGDLLSIEFYINNNIRDASGADASRRDSNYGALSFSVAMQAFYDAQDADDTDSNAQQAAADRAANSAANRAADHADHAADRAADRASECAATRDPV